MRAHTQKEKTAEQGMKGVSKPVGCHLLPADRPRPVRPVKSALLNAQQHVFEEQLLSIPATAAPQHTHASHPPRVAVLDPTPRAASGADYLRPRRLSESNGRGNKRSTDIVIWHPCTK